MMRLGMDPSRNPEYGQIVNGYNDLMEKWNSLNMEIHRRPVWTSLNRFSKSRRKLTDLGTKMGSLQKEFLAHQKKAWDFALNPHFRFDPIQGKDEKEKNILNFYLYHSILLQRIDQFRDDMVLITSNFNVAQSELDAKINFRIAISSFALGLASFLISIFLV